MLQVNIERVRWMTEKTIVEKVRETIEGIEIGYFDTAKPYIFDEYFKYFDDVDFETRKHALFLFVCMLGNWYSKATFVFKPESERLKYGASTYYDFERYLTALLQHYSKIERDFPFMFEFIVVYLILIEQQKGVSYEDWFPEIDATLFQELKEKIFIPNNRIVQEVHPIKYLFREVGIKPFFITDFFDE